jgi:hypothetical protein
VKQRINRTAAVAVCTAMMVCLGPYTTSCLGFVIQQQPTEPAQTPGEKQTVKRFVRQVKEYVSLRERLERKLPNLSDQAKPEEIEAHKKVFEDTVRKARATAKPGDILNSDIASYIRNMIKAEFKGTDRKELRETIQEADTKGIPLRVNYPYPETKELAESPPTLLLRLPQLPKQVKYRFVGRHLLLVDRENGLIVDYMMNALLK